MENKIQQTSEIPKEQKLKRRAFFKYSSIFWKIYFWIFLIFIIPLPPYKCDILYILSRIIDLVGLIGFFGFAYKKRMIFPTFWCVWLFPLLLNDVYGFIKVGSHGLVLDLTVMAIIIPEYIAIFLYGFRSKGLWAKEA